LDPVNADDPARALERLEVAGAAALVEQADAGLRRAELERKVLGDVLELVVLLDDSSSFIAAAMLLCNELGTRYHAPRVSLGWVRAHEVRLVATNHSDRVDPKAEAVQGLTEAMEEALDQDDEIVFPSDSNSAVLDRCHAAYARSEAVPYLVSVPLRANGAPVGILTLERSTGPWSSSDLIALRLVSDAAGRRLQPMHRRDRWWGARFASWARDHAAGLLGPEHTGAKLSVISAIALLLFLALFPGTYRLEAPFILRSDEVAFLPAAFDGFLDEVKVRVGDEVVAGQKLVTLNTRELRLVEATALAEQNSYFAEAQKAQSSDAIAEMQIALARAEQSKARLELARLHLTQAEIRAPFAGVVTEGDLRERIGAPVKQGDVLIKVARLQNLHAEVAMNERGIPEVRVGAPAEVAFASRPEARHRMRVERIEPVATASEDGNHFDLRCVPENVGADWWRPGMGGICKVEAGRRSLLWILTHRTIDWIRMRLWW
jgi:RND family efflux transporter MFP subunit